MNEASIDLPKLPREKFGDSPELGDQLLDLILAKTKTATCWAARDGGPTSVGVYYIVLDSHGRDRGLLRVISIEKCYFCDMTPEFAYLEGEGDRSLEHWRSGHRAYFQRNGGFSDNMELWCEVFELVKAL